MTRACAVWLAALACAGEAAPDVAADSGTPDAEAVVTADTQPGDAGGCDGCGPARDVPAVPANRLLVEEGAACSEARPPGVFDEARARVGLDASHTVVAKVGPGPLPVGAGVGVEDLDGDGALDVVVTGGAGEDQLFLTGQRGPLRWQRYALPRPDNALRLGVYIADANGDGAPDLLFSPPLESGALVFGDGRGGFEASPFSIAPPVVGSFDQSAAWLDADRDGRLDLVVASSPLAGVSGGGAERLYRALGGGSYQQVALPKPAREGFAFIAAPVDFDDDGDLDLYVVNDHGALTLPNRLLRNDGGVFVEVGAALYADAAVWGMGLAVGDANGDGQLDLYTTTMTPADDVLLERDEDGTFTDVSLERGASSRQAGRGVSWGAIFVDGDSDGDEDLFVACGHHAGLPTSGDNPEQQPNVYLVNERVETGVTHFHDGGAAAGLGGATLPSRSPVEADLNHDGFPDLLVGNLGAAPYLYLNGCDGDAAWLGVRLAGPHVGARVRVHTELGTTVRELGSGNDGNWGSGPAEVVVGLGAATEVLALEVRWPSGHLDRWEAPPIRRFLRVYPPP